MRAEQKDEGMTGATVGQKGTNLNQLENCIYPYISHKYIYICLSSQLRTAYSFHKHSISQKRKTSELKLNEFAGYIWAIYHCFPVLFLAQDLSTKSKHIIYWRDSKVVLYSLHHLGNVHSSLVLGLLAAVHITAFSFAGKPIFVLDGTQDREQCVQALIIGIRFINLPVRKLNTDFNFPKLLFPPHLFSYCKRFVPIFCGLIVVSPHLTAI